MAKSKERNKDEYYRAQIRSLEATVRRMQRQLREAEKQALYVSDLEAVIEEEQETININTCPSCKTGRLSETDLGRKKLITCNTCVYRKTS